MPKIVIKNRKENQISKWYQQPPPIKAMASSVQSSTLRSVRINNQHQVTQLNSSAIVLTLNTSMTSMPAHTPTQSATPSSRCSTAMFRTTPPALSSVQDHSSQTLPTVNQSSVITPGETILKSRRSRKTLLRDSWYSTWCLRPRVKTKCGSSAVSG